MASGIAIPELFPFSGTGPSNDYRYDLAPYRPGRPCTAEGWRKLERSYNYLYGRHRREGPICIVNRSVYDGGQTLDDFLKIYTEDDTEAIALTIVLTPVDNAYQITVTESAGAWSDTVDLPEQDVEPVRIHVRIPITVTGWTVIGIEGDALEASHPTVHHVEWKAKHLKRYR